MVGDFRKKSLTDSDLCQISPACSAFPANTTQHGYMSKRSLAFSGFQISPTGGDFGRKSWVDSDFLNEDTSTLGKLVRITNGW